ncbi:GMC family oxidoreductase [Acinetobacter junii]|uniref:GMC family oxidoreductase n=1 Tax=Acinetobacter junii TaxID=40215 RepID=UPI003214B124
MSIDKTLITRRKLLSITAITSVAFAIGAMPTMAGTTHSLSENKKTSAKHTRNPPSKIEPDVIIVGGGSAGAVLAARLSEKTNRNVLLLEAGHAPDSFNNPRIISNSDIVGANLNPEYEWGYKTEKGYINHPIGAIRGKVLGGSSAINGAVAIRARPEDFKRWNLPGWGYDDLLPSFKKLENRHGGNNAIHGRNGPLPIIQLSKTDITPMQQAFMKATVANGFKEIDDFDGTDANGVGPYPMNIVNGVRVNTGIAYLTDTVRARPNLTIRADSMVDRVIFDGKKAIGVRLANGKEIHGTEVILSAGSYGSAAILLRSGVGPAEQSKKLSIPIVADLPVGLNLMDHPFYYNAYAARPDVIGDQSPVIGAKLWTHSSTAKAGELDLHITATHLFPHEMSPTKVGFVLAVALTRPISRGRIWIESKDPLVAPKIDLNFLGAPQDRTRLLEGIKLARQIGKTEPLSNLIHSELTPAADSDEAILASVRSTLDTYHHPTSTAPMGLVDDPNAVVDLQAKVHGLSGLRVVDASIFPDVPSVATNITVIATAEHIASLYR